MSDIFQNIKTKLEKAAIDFSTLDVTTLSGDIKLNATGQMDGVTDYKGIFDQVKSQIISDASKLDLVAHSHKDFDADTLLFVKSELSEGDKELLHAHREAVKLAQEQRAGAVDFLKEITGLK